MNIINKYSTSIYLKVSIEELVKRMSNTKEQLRPMFVNLTTDEVAPFLQNMISKREEDYLNAHHVIESDTITTDLILNSLNQ